MSPTEAEHPGVSSPPSQSLYGLLAEFDSVDALLSAAERVREAGYRSWDCHTPFPVHGLDEAMGQRRTILPWIVFLAGSTGTVIGLVLQWWANATSLAVPYALRGYQFAVSGKPLFSLPANIPVLFELTILLAALAAVFGMLILNRLPRLHHPVLTSERFRRMSQDRFFIAIEAEDLKFDEVESTQLLRSVGAVGVEVLEEGGDA